MARWLRFSCAPASWSAALLRRFCGFAREVQSATALAHSKTWRIFTVLALASLVSSVTAETVPIDSGGVSHAVIVLGKDAGPLDRLAASELRSYIEKLSGAQVKQSSETDVESVAKEDTILLLGGSGQNGISRQLADNGTLSTTGLKPEGFVLKTITWKEHPTVVVAGADAAGTLYGTYELLERMGITFRLTGDILPEKSTNLFLPSLDLRLEPALRRRGFLFAANFDNTSMYSWADYERMLDQMARMKCNYLQFWWFAYAPWLKYGYKDETKWIGDVSTKESGYHNMFFGGFGSRTIDDISIGREHFKDHPRMASLEMQHVETPEEAFDISKAMLTRIIARAAERNIKVWPVVEMASLPPNLARHGELVGEEPFNYVFGTFLHPLDPVNREIQINRLKALQETYPGAEGFFLNFAELYPDLATRKHIDFFERERPRFQELRAASMPWAAALASIYDVGIERVVDSNIGYFDLFSYLMKARDQVAPGMRLGLMTVGRAYALPLFHKMLPIDIPFASLESGGVWTMLGVPMTCFGGMGSRERIIQPRIDDDFDMLGMQFSVRQYAEKDRLFSDGLQQGISGVAGQVERARGTEFNSSFLARASWEPSLTPEQYYHDCAERIFGHAAADEIYQAFMKLEENQAWLGYYEYDGGYGVLLCCSGIRELNASYQYWRQKNPYAGPVMRSWRRLIAASADAIARREGSIALLNEALSHLRAASGKVAPGAVHELNYMINRTEAFRDCLAALNVFRRGMMNFDAAFRLRDELTEEAFVTQLEASLAMLRGGHEQLAEATRKYSEIIDHVCDLAVLYHLNARVVLGTDLTIQLIENVVNYHRGKPYLRKVPLDHLFPQRPDKGADE
ncbi:MAG TPA: alpha-glucuronidase family glycosyl hydrolase [Candidatus Limnocylindrales bacterium]|nr:alpha-glucuronidase family glycosyl hydrolase [Candidatus Limnocylindrales bacterium]